MYWPGADGEYFAETDLAGTINEEYVYLNGARIARVDRPSGAVHYYFSDLLGSASAQGEPGARPQFGNHHRTLLRKMEQGAAGYSGRGLGQGLEVSPLLRWNWYECERCGTRTRGLCRDSLWFRGNCMKLTASIASFGALRDNGKVLFNPNCTRILVLIAPCFSRT
jgi:hypothetical protein